MRTLDTFTFASTPRGLGSRELLAAAVLAAGRTVRLFREECEGFELLLLEAGPRVDEGKIARALKGTK